VSTVNSTLPSGMIAAGASSAPRPPGIVGPAAQVFEAGLYNAVFELPPIWNTRPSGNINAAPIS
jgi:hypothetical protein